MSEPTSTQRPGTEPAGAQPARIVVMGVSGSGKTTVGKQLARALQAEFVEGDDLHPAANKAKMSAGHALTDEDRWPWLDLVAQAMRDAPGPVVASCSALKRAYRDRIRRTADTAFFVHLDGDPDLLRARQAGRQRHFMPTSLMDSQLATLEPLQADEAGVRLDVADGPEALVAQAVAALTR
ncbi:gluconokinase [Nocardioides mangrovicus]|uniref:gluconokinase n=1 Tax=Nocardioides mangrovicus TaxID=2478913 RepID=UPI001E4D5F20|nr:gluconokinase [Nocardioides mangrovicus]